MLYRGVTFPYIHDLAELLSLLEKAGEPISGPVKRAAVLNRFAVFTRYPGIARPVTREEYEDALIIAEHVVRWAEGLLGNKA